MNVSLDNRDEVMDVEMDMLQRYTQESILDDLLPVVPDRSLIAQELDVESRRGGLCFYER